MVIFLVKTGEHQLDNLIDSVSFEFLKHYFESLQCKIRVLKSDILSLEGDESNLGLITLNENYLIEEVQIYTQTEDVKLTNITREWLDSICLHWPGTQEDQSRRISSIYLLIHNYKRPIS